MYITTSNLSLRDLTQPLFFFLCFYFLYSSSTTAAGIFKCVQPNGEVEYTQSPSKNCKAQKIEHQGGQADKKAQEKFKLDKEKRNLEAETKKAEKLKLQDLEKQKEEKKEYCSKLKSNLGRILSSHRVFQKDENGNTILLNEQQRQQRIEESNDKISQHCP